MIKVHVVAEWARLRAGARLEKQSKSKGKAKGRADKVFTSTKIPFYNQLLNACKLVGDDPSGLPAAVFVAAPERLLGKMAYLCLGKKRDLGAPSDPPVEVSPSVVDCLTKYDEIGKEAHFANLSSPGDINRLKHVLVCHGLSPIGDSILLLADLGRAHRVSWALGLPIRVMLADISWMSANRSIRQFESLTEKEIDTGLRVCLDKRRRLYEVVNAQTDLHEIAMYDRADAISRNKLEQISERYEALATALWGERTKQRLTPEDIKLITSPLDKAVFGHASLPGHMRAIGQFHKSLAVLETELRPHLEILRTIARQFHTLDEGVFTYFFAQYYAQDAYRGNGIKVAPISERKFDDPFDKHDDYFRAWGEGHSTTDVVSGQAADKTTRRLAAIYAPHYQVSNLKLLPYSPLSLDALRGEKKDHRQIVKRMIPIDQDTTRDNIVVCLKETPHTHRNRLIADIFSFVEMFMKVCGLPAVDAVCKEMKLADFEELLAGFPEIFKESILLEAGRDRSEGIAEVWDTWLLSAQNEPEPRYVPPHLLFFMLDDDDWDDGMFSQTALLVDLARRLYKTAT